MNVNIKTEKTYDLTGLTEDQVRDLLYFVKKLDADLVPLNGRQKEFLQTLRQDLLNAGVKLQGAE